MCAILQLVSAPSNPPPAFTKRSSNALCFTWNGVCGTKEAPKCIKSLNEAFGEKSPVFTCICGNAIHYACDGACGLGEACMCNKDLNEAFGEKLFNSVLFSFRYLFLCHPSPPPLVFTCICGNAIYYACGLGSVG